MMNHRCAALAVSVVLLVFGPLAFCRAATSPEDPAINALVAKAAAIRDYHYRVERAGGDRTEAAEFWYAGPNRMRARTEAVGAPAVEWFISDDDTYFVNHYEYAAARSAKPRSAAIGFEMGPHSAGAVFLTQDSLASRERAKVTGREAVGGRPCVIIDMASEEPRLTIRQIMWEDDLVGLIPETREWSGSRLWVDAQTGMVRRCPGFSGGRIWMTNTVTATRQVNGFEFPSVIESSGFGGLYTARVTEASVNQGIPSEAIDFQPPANWLVRDETLTRKQVQERLQANPDDANLHYTLSVLDRWRRPDDAIEELRRAAELAPQSPTPLIALANIVPRGREGDPEVAIDALRRAVALAGDDAAHARIQLAFWLDREGKIDEAIAEYRLLAAQGSRHSRSAALQLAAALARQGDYEQAYRLAAEVPVAYWPTDMGGSDMVEWAQEADQLDDMRARVERALAQDPRSSHGRLLLARVLQAQGRKAEAIRALRVLRPPTELRHWADYSQIITLAKELGDAQFAAQVRRAALREYLQSGHPGPLYHLMGEGRPSQAAFNELAREAAALWAEAPGAQTRAAVLKSIRDAARWTHRMGPEGEAPSPDPKRLSPAECAIWGIIQAERSGRGFRPAEQKVRENASACLQRALEKWPKDAVLWADLGGMRWSAKAWQTSAQAYLKAAAAEPGEIEYGARAAFALVRCKQYNRALAMGRQAIKPWADEWLARAFFASLQMECAHSRAARDTLIMLYASPEVGRSGQRRTVARLLARCHERLNEIDQAVAVWKREIAAEASDDRGPGQAYHSLLELCRRHGRRAEGYAAAKATYLAAEEDDAAERAVRAALGLFRDDAMGVYLRLRNVGAERARGMFPGDAIGLASTVGADVTAHPGDAGAVRFANAVYQGLSMPPLLLRQMRTAAEQAAERLRAEAGDSARAWREIAELYLAVRLWDDAAAAGERFLALTPEAAAADRLRGEILVARAYTGKRDYHEARRRLIPLLARATEPAVLREATDALVSVYVLSDERDKAIATLQDLLLRTQDSRLREWIEERLNDLASEE